MVSTLYGWTLLAMLFMVPRPSAARFEAYERIAVAIVLATDDPDEAAWLASVGSWESGYVEGARGRHGEIGVWQLWPPAPTALVDQAREALRRYHAQGMCGYTGELPRAYAGGDCPMARRRLDRATVWTSRHPPPSSLGAGADVTRRGDKP
jgi:hypothetical protein